MTIRPQIFKRYNGERSITHAIFEGERFVGYSRCLCQAMKAVGELGGPRISHTVYPDPAIEPREHKAIPGSLRGETINYKLYQDVLRVQRQVG